jgi:RNase P subunit RPR2
MAVHREDIRRPSCSVCGEPMAPGHRFPHPLKGNGGEIIGFSCQKCLMQAYFELGADGSLTRCHWGEG